MDEILRQLGELLLAAIPTVVVFLILFFAYKLIVHKPLVAVLDERRARTQGAVEKANADIAAAEARTAEYEQRLRDARLSIFKKLEARRQQWLQARTAAVAEARAAAETRVKAARTSLEQDVEQAKVTLQAEGETLASQIIRTVLKPALVAGRPVAGGRQS
ncbi:MAG TPA: ATP synthase F0 subunit B [Terriglobales bacterium]|nr:ATP synthase F0 subunit B [Terriglobales bacterium]